MHKPLCGARATALDARTRRAPSQPARATHAHRTPAHTRFLTSVHCVPDPHRFLTRTDVNASSMALAAWEAVRLAELQPACVILRGPGASPRDPLRGWAAHPAMVQPLAEGAAPSNPTHGYWAAHATQPPPCGPPPGRDAIARDVREHGGEVRRVMAPRSAGQDLRAAQDLRAEEAMRLANAEGLELTRSAVSNTGYKCVLAMQSGLHRFVARVCRDNKKVRVGSFGTAEEAALAVARYVRVHGAGVRAEGA